MQVSVDPHFVFDVVAGIATVGSTIVGLLIKNALSQIAITQERDKAELLAKQIEVKDELNDKHQENREQFKAHEAMDLEKFTGIGRTLDRIDRSLEQLVKRA